MDAPLPLQSLGVAHSTSSAKFVVIDAAPSIQDSDYFHICNPIIPNTDITIEVLTQITNNESSCHQSIVHGMFHMDHLLFDITPEEETFELEFTPCQHIRFKSWGDQKCLNYTASKSISSLKYTSFLIWQV